MMNVWPDVEVFELVDVGSPEEIEAMIGEVNGVCSGRKLERLFESVEMFFTVNTVDAIFPNIFVGDVVENFFRSEDFLSHIRRGRSFLRR